MVLPSRGHGPDLPPTLMVSAAAPRRPTSAPGQPSSALGCDRCVPANGTNVTWRAMTPSVTVANVGSSVSTSTEMSCRVPILSPARSSPSPWTTLLAVEAEFPRIPVPSRTGGPTAGGGVDHTPHGKGTGEGSAATSCPAMPQAVGCRCRTRPADGPAAQALPRSGQFRCSLPWPRSESRSASGSPGSGATIIAGWLSLSLGLWPVYQEG
jgi:hypothetical protein